MASYFAVDDFYKRIGTARSGGVNDGAVEQALEAVSRNLEDWCGRRFHLDNPDAAIGSQDTRVVTLTSSDVSAVDCRCVWLPEDLATSADLVVTIDGDVVDSAEYRLEPVDGRMNGRTGWPYTKIRLLATSSKQWPTGDETCTVEGVWGWPSVPDPVVQACAIQATRIYKRKDSPEGVAGFSDIGSVVRFSASLDPDVRQMLRNYVRDLRLVG